MASYVQLCASGAEHPLCRYKSQFRSSLHHWVKKQLSKAVKKLKKVEVCGREK